MSCSLNSGTAGQCENVATVFIDGNLGTGVSQFLRRIKRYSPSEVSINRIRPLDSVDREGPRCLLEDSLISPERFGFNVQQIATTLYGALHRKHVCQKVKILKRSVHSSINVFGYWNALLLSNTERFCLEHQSRMYDLKTQTEYKGNLWVYLKAFPDKSWVRLQNRSVKPDYLSQLQYSNITKLNYLYDEFYRRTRDEGESGAERDMSTTKRILVIDCNPPPALDWYYDLCARQVVEYSIMSGTTNDWIGNYQRYLHMIDSGNILDNNYDYEKCRALQYPEMYKNL